MQSNDGVALTTIILDPTGKGSYTASNLTAASHLIKVVYGGVNRKDGNRMPIFWEQSGTPGQLSDTLFYRPWSTVFDFWITQWKRS